jgi:hypothetical protein
MVGRVNNSQNNAPAPDPHVFAERDLGRHLQSEFDFRAFAERHVGEQEGTARAEILGEADSLGSGGHVAQRDWEIKSEALSNTAFNTNRRVRHDRGTSLGNRRGRGQQQCNCSAVAAPWEVKNEGGNEHLHKSGCIFRKLHGSQEEEINL